jgi:hypothetical protein
MRSQRRIFLRLLWISTTFLLSLPAQASEAGQFTAQLTFLQGDVRFVG